MSSHYFVFEINEQKLDRRFLDYVIRTGVFRNQVEAQGSTNYAAIRPNDVLGYCIPLPALGEQRRTVAKVDEVYARIEQARRLGELIERELDGLLLSVHRRVAVSAPRKSMREVAPLKRRPVKVEASAVYSQIAVRSFGRGSFHPAPLCGSDVTWQRPHLVREGDILISNIKAWEGAIAVVTAQDDGRVGSHRYLTCVPIRDLATAQFLCFYLLSPEGLQQVGEASPGSADRNRTLRVRALAEIQVPVPALDAQRAFDELYSRVDAIKRIRAENSRAIESTLLALLHDTFGALPDSTSR